MNEDDREELDRIDEQFTRILLSAESKLQIKRTNDRFSDKLHEAKKIRHYWRRIKSLTKVDTHFELAKYNLGHDERNINLPMKEIKQKIK